MKQCSNETKNKNSKQSGRRSKQRKNKRNKNKNDKRRNVLEKPLETFNRQALLLPPNARLRFTLNGVRRDSSSNVWGIRDAMTETNLMFTAWDGFAIETEPSKVESSVINMSLPYCSNGVCNYQYNCIRDVMLDTIVFTYDNNNPFLLI